MHLNKGRSIYEWNLIKESFKEQIEEQIEVRERLEVTIEAIESLIDYKKERGEEDAVS